MSSMYVLRNPVRPIRSANCAGGEFSSDNPHTKIPDGMTKLAYQKYLFPTKPRDLASLLAFILSNLLARSLRAALNAIRSAAVTGCVGLTTTTSEKRREIPLTLLIVWFRSVVRDDKDRNNRFDAIVKSVGSQQKVKLVLLLLLECIYIYIYVCVCVCAWR